MADGGAPEGAAVGAAVGATGGGALEGVGDGGVVGGAFGDAGAGPARVGRRRTRADGRKASVRYSEALAEQLVSRMEAGELLGQVCRESGMPTVEAVRNWARARPGFGARLLAARRPRLPPAGKAGPAFTYSPETAHEIFQRLCDGESLTGIGNDPTMPCLSTIFYWRRRFADFEEAVQLGVRIRAERFCDLSWEMAEAATPETAYLTQVRLSHLRWMTGVMAPRKFRPRLLEPEAPPEVHTVMFRHFKVEKDPETGKDKVVAYCPNPHTGEVEREDTPGYRRPKGPGVWFAVPGG